VLTQIERAIEQRKLAREMKASEPAANSKRDPRAGSMVGHSPAMQHVFKLVGQVAASDATVLVRGESGAGKELIVNAIHHNSTRAAGPLVNARRPQSSLPVGGSTRASSASGIRSCCSVLAPFAIS
jgi:DNA-binding NtrC family response regulator